MFAVLANSSVVDILWIVEPRGRIGREQLGKNIHHSGKGRKAACLSGGMLKLREARIVVLAREVCPPVGGQIAKILVDLAQLHSSADTHR